MGAVTVPSAKIIFSFDLLNFKKFMGGFEKMLAVTVSFGWW